MKSIGESIGAILMGVLLLFGAVKVRAINSVDYPDKIAVGLGRPDTIALDGEWKFQTDPQDIGEKDGWAQGGKIVQRTAKVPLPWELEAEDLRNYSGAAWYEREVMIPAAMEGKRINLGFHGVAHQAKVFVNGTLAGEHSGAQAPFLLDISDLARPGASNTIAVRVFNPVAGVSFYLDSHSLIKVSGLWRSVWLEATGKVFISDLFMIPDIDKGQATARVTVCAPASAEKRTYRLKVTAADPKGRRFEMSGEVNVQINPKPAFYTVDLVLKIRKPMLWDLEHRNLYKVQAILSGAQGQAVDTAQDTFGMRAIEAKGGRFLLNHKPIYLVGGGIDPLPFGGSGDVNWVLPGPYAYPSDEETRQDIRKIKSLGVNFVRIPLRPMHPQWIRLADEEGLLVWQEASWTKYKDLKGYRDAWAEVMLRDRNRPSAIIWTLFNESWGYEFADPIYDFVKALDPTRLALDNTGGAMIMGPNYPGNHNKTDIEDVHYYMGFNSFTRDYWLSLRRVVPDRPLMVSEFGPIPYMFNLGKVRQRWGGKDPWWVNSSLAAYPGQVVFGPNHNHLCYERRYHDWGMDKIYGDWDKFTEAHDWQYFWGLKSQTQWMRQNPELAGYIAWIWDSGQHGTGSIDIFKEVKVFGGALGKIWTQDLVIIDKARHNFWPGETLYANLHVSHFSGEDLRGARIEWTLEGTAIQGGFPLIPVAAGQARLVGDLSLAMPEVGKAAMKRLSARLIARDGRTLSENWEPLWIFPSAWRKALDLPISLISIPNAQPMTTLGYQNVPLEKKPKVALAGAMDDTVKKYVREGGTAIYFVSAQDELLTRNGLQIGASVLWGHSDSFYARKGLGIFDRIPYDNPYIWQFYKIWPRVSIQRLRPENHGDILAGGYINLLNNEVATLAQFRYGKGRLILCAHDLPGVIHDDPAAMIVLNDLIQYATGDFRPGTELGDMLLQDHFSQQINGIVPDGRMPRAGAQPNTSQAWRMNGQAGVPQNYYDGRTLLKMPMAGPWMQFIDTPVPGGIPKGAPLAFVCAFTMPEGLAPETVEMMGFCKDSGWGKAIPGRVRLFKLSAQGNRILFSGDAWGGAGDVDTGQTYVPGKPQTLAIAIDGQSGKIGLFYGADGGQGGPWKNITPANPPKGLLHLEFGPNMVGVNCRQGKGGTFAADYIGLLSEFNFAER